jgi:hypothetical protein
MSLTRGTVDEHGNFVPKPLAKVIEWPRLRRFTVKPRRRKVLGKVLEFRPAGVSARHGQ